MFDLRASVLCLGGLLSAACADQPPAEPELGQARSAVRGSTDGAAVISMPGTVVNRYAALGQDALRGDRRLVLSMAAGLGTTALAPLAAGDVLLIVQPQGADLARDRNTAGFGLVIDYGTAGAFELVTVKSVDDAAGTIQIYGNCGGLRNNYSMAGHTQIIRVPQYASLTVQAGAGITAPAWNGTVGGVVAALVRDGAQVDGLIDASALGFRGGQHTSITVVRTPNVGSFYASLNQQDGGAKGEGVGGYVSEYASIGSYGRGAAGNGGGGGNRLIGGGGGGGNGGALAAWNGQGVMPRSVVGGAQAWPLDPGYSSTQAAFAGGGRGGYTTSSAPLNPTMVAPGTATWLQDFRRERGGLGGRPVPNDPQSHLFFGGGGGAGDDFQDQSGAGGRGGGLVFLVAGQVTGSGRIAANGQNGGPALTTIGGGGGGGAGGILVISAGSITGVAVEARGGAGGSESVAGTQAAGPGGGGGGGYIALPAGPQVSVRIDGGSGGTTASSDLALFPRNGATDGVIGQADGMTSGEFGTSQFCTSADLSVQLTPIPSAAQGRDPLTLQIDVQNQGPSPASDVQFHVSVPDGATLQQKQPGDWDCTLTGADLACKLRQLMTGETSSVQVTLLPPFSAPSFTIAADVSADTLDGDDSNNHTTLTLNNETPVIQKLNGGGLSCAMATDRTPAARGAYAVLALLLSILFATVTRRRSE